MEDSDDIFEDFEAKVKSKKEGLDEHDGEFKKPHEHISEKELLKRRYENEKRALEERYEKEMGILQEKEIKVALKQKKSKTGLKKLKTITYVMIIILLGYITYLFFFNAEKSAEAESTQDTPVSVVNAGNKSNESEEVKQEAPEEVKAPIEEPKEEKEFPGTITLTIDRVYSELDEDDKDLGYITKVVFTIDNGKNKVLTPIVDVYIYDDKMHESWKTRSRGKYTYAIGIKAGDKHTASVDLAPKTYRGLDSKKNIRLALNDTESGFITEANNAITIS